MLNLPSLYYQRLRGDMILLYRLVHHNSDSSLLDLFKNFKYFKSHCNSCHHQNFSPTEQLIIGTSYVPAHIVNTNSIDTFKNELHK